MAPSVLLIGEIPMAGTRILGVHGVGNFQPGMDPVAASGRLSDWWRSALKTLPPSELELEVFYYADLIAPPVAQDRGSLSYMNDEASAAAIAWASQLGAYDEIPQGRLTQPLRVGVEWVARRFGLDHSLVARFVTTFFPEVSRYFADGRARSAATEGLADAIAKVKPQIVIAHSLGSVVAYEALWAHPGRGVNVFLTLGSPLAMPDVVYDRLEEHAGPRGRPPGVRRWINIADNGDIIAIPKGGVSRAFLKVTGDISDNIHAYDFHRVTNYLACPATTGVLTAMT
jgi:hypothetical protein